MKKTFLILTSIFILSFSFAAPVSAHILKTDGAIGAILHVDPEDDPIIGSPSHIFFEIKDKEGKFDTKSCECKISILKAGKEIYTETASSNEEGLSLSFTFTDKNVYQIKLHGSSLVPNSFQSFSLTYDVRVSREEKTSNSKLPFSTNLVYTAGTLIFVLILFYFFKRRGGDDK